MRLATFHMPVVLLIAAACISCTEPSAPVSGDLNRRAPPTLSVGASTRVLPTGGGTLDLEVSALLRNGTRSRIQVAVGPRCPLFVRIFPDPTGEFANSLDLSMACAPDGPTVDLAPGDTVVLRRVLGADTLASFAPGTYGLNVAVTTSTGLIGVWAGAVQLPLTGQH